MRSNEIIDTITRFLLKKVAGGIFRRKFFYRGDGNKMRKTGYFASFAIICLFSLLPLSGNSQEESGMTITDISGNTEKISATFNFFEYSDQHYNSMINHLEVMPENSPNERCWIHFTQIKAANFTQKEGKIGISIECDNGETVSGIFPDNEMKISGKGAFGDIGLEVQKLKKLEFSEFEVWRVDKFVKVTREEASLEWKKENKMPSVKWTIVDGDKKEEVSGLGIRDSYETNSRGFLYYTDRFFRDADILDNAPYPIQIQKGATKIQIRLDELAEFTITGNMVEEKPEVTLVKNGDSLTAPLLVTKSSKTISSKNDKDIQYGPFDGDDMLIWRVPCGYKGKSLLPARRITMKRIQETAPSPTPKTQ